MLNLTVQKVCIECAESLCRYVLLLREKLMIFTFKFHKVQVLKLSIILFVNLTIDYRGVVTLRAQVLSTSPLNILCVLKCRVTRSIA